MKYFYVTCFSIILLVRISTAQTAASYNYTPATEPYQSIEGNATNATFTGDDLFQTNIQIGFPFTYCGTTYYSFYASSNGYISLPGILPQSGAPSSMNQISSLAQLNHGIGMLCPYWDDLDGTGRNAFYATSGSAPNRIFTIEWKNFGQYGGLSGASADTVNFQIKLFEQSNIIKFCYGYSNNIHPFSSTIGIVNSTTDYQTLGSSTPFASASNSVFTITISSFPTSGQVYMWIPSTTDVEEFSETNELKIFSNLLSSQTTITFSKEQKNASVKISDITGNEVKTIFFSGNELTIDKENMSSGVYFLLVTDDRKQIFTRKIIVP